MVRTLATLCRIDSYASETLTVRDLLSHRTGLPRHDALWFTNSACRSAPRLCLTCA